MLVLCAAAAITAVHLYTRVAPLSMSLTHDEAYTVVNYVSHGPVGIYLEPYIVNNHVLFSLLAWATTRLLGATEAAYRLWSVVPAITAVGWMAWWTHRRFGPITAFALAVLATAAPLLATYAVLARGYGLSLLACVAMLICTVQQLECGDRRSLRGLVAAGVVGFWAYPLVAAVFAGHAAVLFALRPAARVKVARMVAVTAMLSLFTMAPLIPALVEDAVGLTAVPSTIASGERGSEAAAHPVTGMLRQVVPAVPRTTSPLIAAPVVALYLLLGFVGLARVPAAMRAMLVLPMAALLTFHLVSGVLLEARFLVPVLLHALLPVALGVDALRAALVDRPRPRRMGTLGGLTAAALLLTGAVTTASHLRQVPLQEARAVAAAIDASTVEGTVLTNEPDPVALRYYADQPVRSGSDMALRERACSARPFAAVVVFGKDALTESCLRARGATGRTFEQQWSEPATLYLPP